MGTIAETLLEQGEARGLAKREALGLSRGRLEGLAAGKAETLLRIARRRFGDVPATRADMVLSADAETLDRWLDALFGADILDEVFEHRRPHWPWQQPVPLRFGAEMVGVALRG